MPVIRTPSFRRMRRHGAGGTLLGVFIGLVLGIAIAATVGLYVTGGWKAYQQQIAGTRESVRDAPKIAAKPAEPEKPRFDFYKILPGDDAKTTAAKPVTPDRATVADKTEKSDKAKAAEKVATADPSAAKPSDRFWLQAGSFVSESEAENLRARLALVGWEAQLQQGQLPDKSVRYRVRLGPYDNVDELNRIKGELARRGFDVAVIRL
ncbi:MAG TPA: SPOR domain-containing protein [Casimicrobiaceae bacterium]|nr:SPOR domain-containing protein [Casimicrobiaceae bacterium]